MTLNYKIISKQKELAENILSTLISNRIVEPMSVLAGGAPRNWDFEIPANDLDFYLVVKNEKFWFPNPRIKEEFKNYLDKSSNKPSEKEEEEEEDLTVSVKNMIVKKSGFIKAFNFLFPEARKTKEENGKEYSGAFIECEIDNQKIQLMTGLSTISNNFHKIIGFDFGINKIWMDQFGKITKFYQYNIDKENKKLTIWSSCLSKDNNYKKLSKRKAKIKKYFPDFELDLEDETEEQEQIKHKFLTDVELENKKYNEFLDSILYEEVEEENVQT